MSININTASKEELKLIPGIGEKVAELIIRFRQRYGVVKKEALDLALRGNVSDEAWDMIDFSEPRTDPFDIDIRYLPSVPKTDSWEPLVSFSHQSMSREPGSPSKTMWQPLTLSTEKPMPTSPYESELNPHFGISEYTHSARLPESSDLHLKKESMPLGSKPYDASHKEKVTPMLGISSKEMTTQKKMGSSAMLAASDQGPHELRFSKTGSEVKSHGEKSDKKYSTSHKARKEEIQSKNETDTESELSVTELPKSVISKSRSGKSRSQSSSRSTSGSRSHKHHSRRSREKKHKDRSRKKSYKHLQSQSRSSSSSVSRSDSRSSSRKHTRSNSSSRSTSHESRRKLKLKKTMSSRKSRTTTERSRSPSRHERSKVKSRKHKRSSVSSKRHDRSRSDSRSPSKPHSRHHERSKAKSRKHKRSRSNSKRHDRSRSNSRSPSRSHKSKRKTRSHKLRSRKYYSSSSDSDTDSSDQHHSYKHGNPQKHPKTLRFDGKTNWLSFKKKFESYRKVMNWTETESKDYLMWSLEGKALDYFTITTPEIEDYSFRRIMKKLESRFGVKELAETSKTKFRQAYQKQEESLEDWADRVMTLATPAFVDLPDEHMKSEAIAKFCQGCSDKDAAKHVCFEHPSSMEDALNLVKHHQYISQAVDGKKTRRSTDTSVNVVQSPSDSRVEQLLEKIAAKLEVNPSKNSQLPNPEPKSNSDVAKNRSMQCFFCKKFGHAKKDCRAYTAWLKKKQLKSDNLKDQGLDGKTTHPSPKK